MKQIGGQSSHSRSFAKQSVQLMSPDIPYIVKRFGFLAMAKPFIKKLFSIRLYECDYNVIRLQKQCI